MPSTYSISNSSPFDSSTVMAPSLPTLSITSAIRSPISWSAAEMAAMLAISCLPLIWSAWSLRLSTSAPTPFWIPRLIIMGLAPAATFLSPSFRIVCARTVAVVVPSPAMSLVLLAASLISWAPMLANGSSSSISLATVTRVVGDGRPAVLLTESYVSTLRSQSGTDRVRHYVDSLDQVVPGFHVHHNLLGHLHSSPFAFIPVPIRNADNSSAPHRHPEGRVRCHNRYRLRTSTTPMGKLPMTQKTSTSLTGHISSRGHRVLIIARD